NFAPAVEALMPAPAPNCRIVIEAGDLKRNAPLRAVCERAKNAAVLPCYQDAEKDLIRLIDQEMGEAGLAISPEARAALIPLLRAPRSPRPLKASSHSSASIADLSSKRRSGYGHQHGYNVRWRSSRKPRSKHAGSPRWPNPLRGAHC